jgi:hypothetical protein
MRQLGWVCMSCLICGAAWMGCKTTSVAKEPKALAAVKELEPLMEQVNGAWLRGSAIYVGSPESATALRKRYVEAKGLDEDEAYHVLIDEEELALDSSFLPESLRTPQRFTLITSQGALAIGPSRAVVALASTGEDEVVYVFDVPEGVEDGLMFVLPEGVASAGLKLRGEEHAPEGEHKAAIIKHVETLLAAQRAADTSLEQDARSYQGDEGEEEPCEIVMEELDPAEDIKVVRGRFGDGMSLLVNYVVPRPACEGSNDLGAYSGVFLLNDEARGVRSIRAGIGETTRYGVLVDLNQDGVDEFILTYDEGDEFFVSAGALLFGLVGGAYQEVQISAFGG